MDTDDTNRTSSVLQRVLTPRVGLFILVVFVVVVSLVSVGIAEAVSTVVGSKAVDLGQSSQMFESVAAIFSGLAFIALVITFLLQLEELRMQRHELESQRHEMSRSQGELHRSAEADLRRLHFELLKMSIDDADLAEVWGGDLDLSLSHEVRRKYLYANLIYQHQRLAMELEGLTDEHRRIWVRQIFQSALMREFWSITASARNRYLVPGTAEWKFMQMTDEVLSEWNLPTSPDGEVS
jgi:hypothetical protein